MSETLLSVDFTQQDTCIVRFKWRNAGISTVTLTELLATDLHFEGTSALDTYQLKIHIMLASNYIQDTTVQL